MGGGWEEAREEVREGEWEEVRGGGEGRGGGDRGRGGGWGEGG